MNNFCDVQEELNMRQDIEWKEFFSDDERYADVINGLVCGGRQVVKKTDLQELDTQTGFLRGMNFVRHWRGRVEHRRSSIRDCVRKVAFGVNFAVIGIENQEVTDYSIPLRNMVYDTGEYERQALRIRREIRKNSKGLRAGEYLYGFRKESRLRPVVTFILYSGKEAWDGPVSLHDILDFTDFPNALREMVADYKIHLVEIRKLKDTSVFKTDVRQVFDFIRCAEDKNALRELVEHDDYYKNMEEDAFDVASRYAHAAELIAVKDYYGKEGKINMCKAIEDLMADSRKEGREEGGRNEAERINRLNLLLSEQGRMDDLIRAAKDREYQERLFREELGGKS